MILRHDAIIDEWDSGRIVIDPFDTKRVGPNSYDLTLDPVLGRYTSPVLDCKKEQQLELFLIPEEGLILCPGILYIASTNETAGTTADSNLVACIEGKSGVGRLGITTHQTAGFGDIGWCHATWTLEITVAQHVRVYPNQLIAQVFFFRTEGTGDGYSGNYIGQRGPQASRLWKSFK